MNKPILLANKGLRVNEQETGGSGENFDPMSVLSNTKVAVEIKEMSEAPIEEILMSKTLWPES